MNNERRHLIPLETVNVLHYKTLHTLSTDTLKGFDRHCSTVWILPIEKSSYRDDPSTHLTTLIEKLEPFKVRFF